MNRHVDVVCQTKNENTNEKSSFFLTSVSPIQVFGRLEQCINAHCHIFQFKKSNTLLRNPDKIEEVIPYFILCFKKKKKK